MSQNATAGSMAGNYQESPMALGETHPLPPDRIMNIEITQVDHGYIVRVGCQTIAIETDTKLISLLSAYIANPAEIQKQYQNKTLFK